VLKCCCAGHTLHAGLDDLLQVAQAFVVDDPDKVVRAAAQGHLDVVRDIVRKHPSKVDAGGYLSKNVSDVTLFDLIQ